MGPGSSRGEAKEAAEPLVQSDEANKFVTNRAEAMWGRPND
jgi:hypothetical protein